MKMEESIRNKAHTKEIEGAVVRRRVENFVEKGDRSPR